MNIASHATIHTNIIMGSTSYPSFLNVVEIAESNVGSLKNWKRIWPKRLRGFGNVPAIS